MNPRAAVIGAGVSGLTSAVVLAESGFEASILADVTGDETNSAAAAAIWYPYDVGSSAEVIPWALVSYRRFLDLARQPETGVSVTELRVFSRLGPIAPPDWAQSFATRPLAGSEVPSPFVSGFAIHVPLIETGQYLAHLVARVSSAGGSIPAGIHFPELESVARSFDLSINCAGIGARELVPDPEMEPHRGQVAIVQKFDLPYAIVCDDPPLIYAIPRSNDCVFGGTNEVSGDRMPDPRTSAQIISECERVLG